MPSKTFSIISGILGLLIIVSIGAYILKVILNFSDLVLVLIILVLLMYVAHDWQENHGKKEEKKPESKKEGSKTDAKPVEKK